MVRGAASGDAAAKEDFGRLYLPLVRSFLASRWRWAPLRNDIDDASQEVFLECFRRGGALPRADSGREGGFRAFLFGIVHHVALRFERKAARTEARGGSPPPGEEPAQTETPSRIFEREWALAVMRAAGERQARKAGSIGTAAVRRVELLRLRFHEGLPIREIAEQWGEDASRLHHEYATARAEFREALLEEIAFHAPGTRAEVERESVRLLEILR